jgi:radical SAM superfamily enzyme YgiQ (UPF0313 family)
MRVALITSGHESLGIESLSARLKQDGHEVRLYFDPKSFGGGIFLKIDILNMFFDLKRKIIDQVLLWQPDIIGFSCMTHNYRWGLMIAIEIKKRKNIPIIFGGMHSTMLPDEVIKQKCVDYVAIGEAEGSFSLLLDEISNRGDLANIPGIYSKRGNEIIKNPVFPLIRDLNSLPFADKDLFYEKMPILKKIAYSISASRGCLFSCSYCCNDYLKKIYKDCQFYRMRSVDNVISELKSAKQKYNIKSVIFYDEVFPSAIPWLKEFSLKYKHEINLPFVIYYHFKLCSRERLLLLKQAGCKGLGFGLQSTSERIRREILNRKENNEQVKHAVKLCKELDLTVNIDHILGLPTETEADLKYAVEFYRALKPNLIYSYWLTLYPQTSIIDIAIKNGIITEKERIIINNGESSNLHKGSFIKQKKMLLKYELLFDLIPLLPENAHKYISQNEWLLNILPKGYISHFILIFITMIKLKEKMSLTALRILFSKKYVP